MSDTASAQYAAVLGRIGTVVEVELSGLDRLGVPVTSCSLAVDGRFAFHGNGYGMAWAAARASGLGELAEGALSAAHLARLPRREGSRTELVRRLGADAVVDPRLLGLPAGSDYDDDRPLRWVPTERVRTGETVWVPEEFVASDPVEVGPGPSLVPPITNGLGAGLDPVRPLTHGLLELLQRHTNGLRFRALDARSPVIVDDDLPASVAGIVAAFRARGVRPVLKHAASELGVVSTYVTGVDENPGAGIAVTACGEAAHPSAEVSLTKAVLEYANSRARKMFCFGPAAAARAVTPEAYWRSLPPVAETGEPRAVAAMAAWGRLAPEELRALTAPEQSRTVDYAAIARPGPAPAAGDDLLAHLLDHLDQDAIEHDVLTVRSETDGVVVAKTLVTGLEAEILSYGRLGERGVAELLATDLDLVRVQPGPSEDHHDRVRLTAAAEERLGGPAWYSYARAARLVGPLYPLYREPPRHAVAVGE